MVREQVRQVVAAVLGIAAVGLDGATRLDALTTPDSLTLVEIAAGLDDAFAIRVPTEAMVGARTIDDLVALVEACQGRAAGPAAL